MDFKDTTAGMLTIQLQELTVNLDKLQVSIDTLKALYQLDAEAIKLFLKAQCIWSEYVKAELYLVEHDWKGGTICPLQIAAVHNDLVIARIKYLDRLVAEKKSH